MMKMLKLSQSFPSISLIIKVFTLAILIKPLICKTNNNSHLNCGSPTTTFDNQIWYNDENTTFAPPSVYTSATKAVVAASKDTYSFDRKDVLSLICTAARTFHAPFTYSIPVTYGPKFVRLTFCALGAVYDNNSSENFFLSVQANGGSGSFTLLHNYSAYLHEKLFEHTFKGPVSKEFLVMATASRLNLTFSPTSPAFSGFVNAIEIVDVPDHLYDYLTPSSIQDPSRSPCTPATIVSSSVVFSVLGAAALETVVRLNVGGMDIDPVDDSGEMSRSWYKDDEYLNQRFIGSIPYNNNNNNSASWNIHYSTSIPEYTAPSSVYSTARVMGPNNETFNDNHNLTWEFNVDSGFNYLVRLHFCEVDIVITKGGEREFDILINNQEAKDAIDVMSMANGSPVCMDYVASNVGDMSVSLGLTLRPDIKNHPRYHDVILNGIEIFKLNQSGGNLAGPNPAPPLDDVNQLNKSQSSRRGSSTSSHLHTIEIVVGSLVLIPIFIAFAYYWWMNHPCTYDRSKWLLNMSKSSTNSGASASSSLPSSLCHFFPLKQIKAATSNFNDDFIIGKGGFGKVYKGSLSVMEGGGGGTQVMVAIKRLNPSSKQGANEFRTEIQMLTALRHVHLVSLIGFCDENGEMILVYDYMPLGTLQDHLYQKHSRRNNQVMDDDNTNFFPMPWKLRLMTCIGAARGLHYLHSETHKMVIHRDVKSTNILLDKNWVAKVADFGISKIGPSTEEGCVSTLVKGSIGYLDPEYLRLKKLTLKSDVYSFGVVLFEVLCARSVMNASLQNEQVNLVTYATNCYKENTLHEIVDPNVRDEIAPECLRTFGETAVKCVRDQGSQRPSMEEVICCLEFALQLQQTADDRNNKFATIPCIVQLVNDNQHDHHNSTTDTCALLPSTTPTLSSDFGQM